MNGFVTVPGGSLYTEIDGTGPAVLLVHAGVANVRMWDPHLSALAERHTVIRYDTRGFGRTESEHVEFSNRADLIAVLDHAGVDRAVLVGVSRGGMIALDTTLEFPDRVAGLVWVAGGVGGYEESSSSVAPEVWEEAEARWKAKDWDWLTDMETRLWVDGPGQSPDRVDPGIRALVSAWIHGNYVAEKEEGVPQPLDPPAIGRLADVTCPLLVVIGGLDEAGTVESGRALASLVRGAVLEEFTDAAHMLNLEQPERFTRMLLAFADRVYG